LFADSRHTDDNDVASSFVSVIVDVAVAAGRELAYTTWKIVRLERLGSNILRLSFCGFGFGYQVYVLRPSDYRP